MNTPDNSIDNSLQFIKDYPTKGTIDPTHINWNANQYYDKLYSYSYRGLLEKYNKSDKSRELIKKHILDVLEDKILIDLGCGSYACNLAAVAYLANAKAYMGIDINADLTDYNDIELKNYLKEQYNLSECIESHQTIIRTVFDNFENFLERAPDNAGYNFTINGLVLNESMQNMKKHLQRIMIPGNIILANTTENIYIPDILIGPHKHTEIFKIYGDDSIHIYEKLDTSIQDIQKDIVLRLK